MIPDYEGLQTWGKKRELLVSYDRDIDHFAIKRINLNEIDLENISLEKLEASDVYYYVSLERCDTPGKFIDWLRHLCEKTWVSKDTLDCFIERMLQVAARKKLEGFVFYNA